MSAIHLCIATGQNAANLIPIKQLGATEVWILETLAMKALHSAADLKTALQPYVPSIKVLPFDDSTPQAIGTAAARLPHHQRHAPRQRPATRCGTCSRVALHG